MNVADACTGPPFNEYEYGAVPPDVFKLTAPLLAEQVALCEVELLLRMVGSDTMVLPVTVHPLMSVTVTV